MKPQLVLLGGPNGAGKSTFYTAFLRELHLPFLNADVFEARTGIPSVEAARILDVMRDLMIEQGAGLITETVFSDPVGAKLGMLRKAVAAGYDVILIYIALDPSLQALRIDARVRAGGHDVPRDRIAKRFARSLDNLRAAIAFVPLVKIYDNSSATEPHRLIATYEAGKRTFAAKDLPAWVRPVIRRRAAKRAR